MNKANSLLKEQEEALIDEDNETQVQKINNFSVNNSPCRHSIFQSNGLEKTNLWKVEVELENGKIEELYI